VPYISLIALFFSVTNLVPLSAIGFTPIVLCWWRFFDRKYPDFMGPLAVFTAYAALSTLLYDRASFLNYDFYRYDGNFFVSYAPIFAGCVYSHRWNLNKVLKWFFVSAILVNLPYYAWYLAENSLLSIFIHPADTFGSYFIARNAAGGFLAMLFCLGVACYMQQRSRILLALLALNLLMLLSTYSRGSMLGMGVMLSYLVLGRKRWMLGSMMAIFVAASLAVAIYYTHPYTDYMGYMFTINDSNPKAGNLAIRYEWLWPRALAYFRQSPIVGLGFGSFDDQIGCRLLRCIRTTPRGLNRPHGLSCAQLLPEYSRGTRCSGTGRDSSLLLVADLVVSTRRSLCPGERSTQPCRVQVRGIVLDLSASDGYYGTPPYNTIQRAHTVSRCITRPCIARI
jgi:O-antigen ligase